MRLGCHGISGVIRQDDRGSDSNSSSVAEAMHWWPLRDQSRYIHGRGVIAQECRGSLGWLQPRRLSTKSNLQPSIFLSSASSTGHGRQCPSRAAEAPKASRICEAARISGGTAGNPGRGIKAQGSHSSGRRGDRRGQRGHCRVKASLAQNQGAWALSRRWQIARRPHRSGLAQAKPRQPQSPAVGPFAGHPCARSGPASPIALT